LPIQAALEAAYAAGGGSVVLPKNTVPYYIDDTIYVKDNTTFTCEDWIVLADYTTTGGTFGAQGSNIVVENLMLDNSNIYAGGSGQNGFFTKTNVVGLNKNVKFSGGIVKNCKSGNNDDGTGDGGKGVQIEPGDGEDIVIDGMTFSNCFMAMSTIRDFGTTDPYYGILYSNITADNCKILFFVRQANATQSQTGLQHSVQLNNFYAVNCGTFEGVLQFSRASNIQVSNGIVVTSPSASAQALIRGNHANCTFTNIGWYGVTSACINLDPSTYAIDSSQAVKNNVYKINIWGAINFIADANIATPYRTLDNCYGEISFVTPPATAFFGYELRNGTSTFLVASDTKQAVITTIVGANTSGITKTFADLSAGYNVPQINNYYQVFTAIASTNLPNNSLFLNSATSKLSFKDGTGAVNALY
jgi:hypothetical protein